MKEIQSKLIGKIKKKYIIVLIITFIIYINFPTYSYANGVCLIKDSSAPVLLEYIKDNRKVVKNVTKAIIKKGNVQNTGVKKVLSDVNNIGNETVSIFNEIFSFSGYQSYFRYFVEFPIQNKIPYEVKRDYKILSDENEGLINYLYKLDQKGNMDILVEDACKGVVGKCELYTLTTKSILKKLIQNNSYILDLYRLTIMGETNNFTNANKLILTKNNFILEIEKYYGIKAINSCNQSEGKFGYRTQKAIENIKLMNKRGQEGKQKWIDAWQLIIGNTSKEEEAELEKKLLMNQLAEQGVSTSNKEIMMKNLEKFNSEGGFSENNNFIANSINNITKKINSKIEEFLQENVLDFFQKQSTYDNVSVNAINDIETNSKTTKEIQQKISELYENEIPFTAIGNVTTENLRAKIIKTHMSLDDSIKILEETITISQLICNTQGGGGKCD